MLTFAIPAQAMARANQELQTGGGHPGKGGRDRGTYNHYTAPEIALT